MDVSGANLKLRAEFSFNAGHDADQLAADFAARRRLRIPNFLSGTNAQMLHEHLREREDWQQVVNQGDRTFSLDRAARAGMDAEQQAQLDEAIYANARTGFQYRYETIRVPDEPAARDEIGDPLNAFAQWLSRGDARALLRRVTGREDVDFADAQATAYSPNDFLTRHDDEIDGKKRIAAYVLNLTPIWRAEWGGILQFHESDGSLTGFVPEMNTLNLFAVPQLHSVSIVSRAAAYRRYSITGWLRAC